MKVNIIYPSLDTPESLEAVEVSPGVVELRQHAGFIPLAPGDRVQVDQSGDIVGIEHLEPLFTYEVQLAMPSDLVAGKPLPEGHPSRAKIAQMREEWARDAWVTQVTNFTFLVSSQSRLWLEDKVAGHPYVKWVDLMRTPDLRMDLTVATAHPDLDGQGGGPWA